MSSEPVVVVRDEKQNKPKKQPPYHVILLNDDFHTAIYVIILCQKIFGYTVEKGTMVAEEVHTKGRAILWTGARELAELRQQQIHSLGKDPMVSSCKGSMTSVIEPAE